MPKRTSANAPELRSHALPRPRRARSDYGGWPKARMKAPRISSGSRKPVGCATRSIASLDDRTRSLATSTRNRSTTFDGVVPVSCQAIQLARHLIDLGHQG
jgi:hypothetical protein